MKKLAVVAVVCLAVNLAQSQVSPPQPRVVKTTGTAEIKVTPDQVAIEIGVERQNSKAKNARNAVAEVSRKIISALKALGIDEKDIQTAYLSLQPMIDYSHGLHISNFTAEQSLAVKVRDISKLDDVMDAVVAAGANRIGGVEYQSSELRKYKDQARDAAVKAAREKADALAMGLGNQLGKTYSIEEAQQPEAYYPYANFVGGLDKARAEPTGPSTAPGQLTVTASVIVSFDLL